MAFVQRRQIKSLSGIMRLIKVFSEHYGNTT